MKIQAAKAKGRRACMELMEALKKRFGLKDGEIYVNPSSSNGEDLLFSYAFRQRFNYAVEVKNSEALNIWKALEQSERHAESILGSKPCVVFRKNRTPLMICLRLDDFLEHYHESGHSKDS